ncbi:MAG: phage tail protein [Gammaproteobacteria bacterium]|nr:phage tail protein [Gammaproteobacteria bacterium]
MRMEVSLKGIERAIDRMKATPQQLSRAEVRAIKKTIRGGKATTAKLIREHYVLKAAEIKSRISSKDPEAGQKLARGYLYFSDYAIPLELYGNPHPGKKGVSVTVEKGKGRQLFRGAFFRKDGKPGIWKRVSAGAGTGELVARTPIRRLWGPSLASIIRRDLIDQISADTGETLRKRYSEELNYELRELRAK